MSNVPYWPASSLPTRNELSPLSTSVTLSLPVAVREIGGIRRFVGILPHRAGAGSRDHRSVVRALELDFHVLLGRAAIAVIYHHGRCQLHTLASSQKVQCAI